MFDHSIVTKSGQLWKFWLGLSGVMIGGLSMMIGLVILKHEIGIILLLSGSVIAVMSFVFECMAIRCPGCKSRWLWTAIKSQDSSNWLWWLFSQTECPTCKTVCNTPTRDEELVS